MIVLNIQIDLIILKTYDQQIFKSDLSTLFDAYFSCLIALSVGIDKYLCKSMTGLACVLILDDIVRDVLSLGLCFVVSATLFHIVKSSSKTFFTTAIKKYALLVLRNNDGCDHDVRCNVYCVGVFFLVFVL